MESDLKNRKNFRKVLRIVIIILAVTVLLRTVFSRLKQNKIKSKSQTTFKDTSISSINLDPYSIQDAIIASAEFLNQIIKPNGQFIYRINLNPKVKLKKKYNMLRHAGTMYALAMYYDWHPDVTTLSVLESAGQFFQDYLKPIPERDDLLAIWSSSKITGSGDPLQVKLGGAGLGLVALANLEKIKPGTVSHDDLKKIGNFIIYMQKKDGSFYSKYFPDKGRDDRWESLYYPGEAALGLLMLHEIEPSNIWLDASAKALEYLALTRKNSSVVPADHWALLATNKLIGLCSEETLPVPKELLINHAIQLCESILREQVKYSIFPVLEGAFTQDGRTTPAATRIEGLLAALSFLPEENKSLQNRIEAAVEKGIGFLLRAQIRSGKYAGAMPRAICQMPGTWSDAKKFNRRATELRIDYAQHAMCAMMQYLHFIEFFNLK